MEFFATTHGKGAVGSIGGTVKQSVWRAVKTGKNRISDASKYASVAKERNPNINIEFISSNKIEEKTQHLSAIWEKVLIVLN